jgi:serine/threonine protein kinase
MVDGKYKLLEHLASGAYGNVFRAENTYTKQQVAIKSLHAHLVGAEHIAERMKREARVISRLSHPNHVFVFDGGIFDRRAYHVMELLDGRDLRRALVEEGPLPIQQALYIVSETADGLKAVHDINVTHRDVKPENIFLTFGNVVKLLDFGLAKYQEVGPRLTARGINPGTLPYESPEQLDGEDVDPRTDIFALGVILYELILGRHPFAFGPASWPPESQLRHKMVEWQPPALSALAPKVPDYVCAIVEKAIRRDPADRYQTADEFRDAIEEAKTRYILSLSFVNGEQASESGDRSLLSVVSSPSEHQPNAQVIPIIPSAMPMVNQAPGVGTKPPALTRPAVPSAMHAQRGDLAPTRPDLPAARKGSAVAADAPPVRVRRPRSTSRVSAGARLPYAVAIAIGGLAGTAIMLWLAGGWLNHHQTAPAASVAAPVAAITLSAQPIDPAPTPIPTAAATPASASAAVSAAGATPAQSVAAAAVSAPRPAASSRPHQRSKHGSSGDLVVPDFDNWKPEAPKGKRASPPMVKELPY